MMSQRIGPYQIEEMLGAGGMGEVYRAYDDRLNRMVAIKLVRAGALGNAEAEERLPPLWCQASFKHLDLLRGPAGGRQRSSGTAL